MYGFYSYETENMLFTIFTAHGSTDIEGVYLFGIDLDNQKFSDISRLLGGNLAYIDEYKGRLYIITTQSQFQQNFDITIFNPKTLEIEKELNFDTESNALIENIFIHEETIEIAYYEKDEINSIIIPIN